MAECNKQAGLLASAIMIGDEGFAKQVTKLSGNINDINAINLLTKGEYKSLLGHKKDVLKYFVYAGVLNDVAGNVVHKNKLIKSIRSAGGKFSEGMDLLNTVDNFNIAKTIDKFPDVFTNLGAKGQIEYGQKLKTIYKGLANKYSGDFILKERFGIKNIDSILERINEGDVKRLFAPYEVDGYLKSARQAYGEGKEIEAINNYIIARAFLLPDSTADLVKVSKNIIKVGRAKLTTQEINKVDNIGDLIDLLFVNIDSFKGSKKLIGIFNKKKNKLLSKLDGNDLELLMVWDEFKHLAKDPSKYNATIKLHSFFANAKGFGYNFNTRLFSKSYNKILDFMKNPTVPIKVAGVTLNHDDAIKLLPLFHYETLITNGIDIDSIMRHASTIDPSLKQTIDEYLLGTMNLKKGKLGDYETIIQKQLHLLNSSPKLVDSENILMNTVVQHNVDIKRSVFFKHDDGRTTGLGKNTMVKANMYGTAYKSNSIKIGEIPKFTKKQLSELGSNKDIDYIIVENVTARNDSAMNKIIKKINGGRFKNKLPFITVTYPKGKQIYAFSFDKGNLYLNAQSERHLSEVVDRINHLNVPLDFRNTDLTIRDAQIKFYNTFYGDADEVEKIFKEKYGDISPLEVDARLKAVTDFSGRGHDVVNLGDKRDELPSSVDFYMKEAIAIANLDKITIPKNIKYKHLDQDYIKQLYFNYKYNNSIEGLVKSKHDFMGAMGIHTSIVDGDVLNIRRLSTIDSLASDGLVPPLIKSYDMFDALNVGKAIDDEEWIRHFIKKNKALDAFQTLPGADDTEKAVGVVLAKYNNNIGISIAREVKPDELLNKTNTPKSGFGKVFMPEVYDFFNRAKLVNVRAVSPMGTYKLLKKFTQKINERKAITSLLDTYEKNFIKMLEDGASQQDLSILKKELGVALDTIEQGVLKTKFGHLYDDNSIGALIGGKYSLWTVSNIDELDNFKKGMQRTRDSYNDMFNDLQKRIQGVSGDKEQILKTGVVSLKTPNGHSNVTVISYLKEQIEQLPDGIGDLSKFKDIDNSMINALTREEQLRMAKMLEYANKVYISEGGLEREVYYKLYPELRLANFFENYVLEEFHGELIPRIMRIINPTSGLGTVVNFIAEGSDIAIKSKVFKRVNKHFKKGLEQLDDDTLKEWVELAVMDYHTGLKSVDFDDFDFDMVVNSYHVMFKPYTKFKGLQESTNEFIKKMVDVDINNGFVGQLGDTFDDIMLEYGDVIIKTANGDEIRLADTAELGTDNVFNKIFDKEKGEVPPAPILTEVEITALARQEKDFVMGVINDVEVVSELRTKAARGIINDNNQLLQKTTSGQILVDVEHLTRGMAEEASRRLQIGTTNYARIAANSLPFVNQILKGRAVGINMDNFKIIRSHYEGMLKLGDNAFKNIDHKALDEYQLTAYKVADYFRTLGRQLGSLDGSKGVTTSVEINKKLYNIGDSLLNVDSERGLFRMIQGIQSQERLTFMAYFKEGQSSWDELLSQFAGKYRLGEIISANDVSITNEVASRWNTLFNSDYSIKEIRRLTQSFSGTLFSNAVTKWYSPIINFFFTVSGVTRTLLSYPYAFFGLPYQVAGYTGKIRGMLRSLGVDPLSLKSVGKVRESFDILVDEFFEMNPYKVISNGLKRLKSSKGQESLDELLGLVVGDDYTTVLKKRFTATANKAKYNKMYKAIDNVKDNANNFVDGLFSRNMKNVAFLKALRSNPKIQFLTVDEFIDYMKRIDIDDITKQDVLDSIKTYASRHFGDLMGLGYSASYKVQGSNALESFLVGTMQTQNFRGSRGLSIFRKVYTRFRQGGLISSYLVRNGFSDKSIDEVVNRLHKTPEFQNMSAILMNDMYWALRVWRQESRNEEYDRDISLDDLLSIIPYTSQSVQGIESFGGIRAIKEGIFGAYQSWTSPELYSDPTGLGSFLQSFFVNLGRHYKLGNFSTKVTRVWLESGSDVAKKYFLENWDKLSSGTMRYMIDQDTYQKGMSYSPDNTTGMGRRITGTPNNRDKSFLFNQFTNKEALRLSTSLNDPNSEVTVGVIFKDMWNKSQMGKTIGEIIKIRKEVRPELSIKDIEEKRIKASQDDIIVGDYSDFEFKVRETKAGKERLETGAFTPETQDDYFDYKNFYIPNTYPGAGYMVKTISTFLETGKADKNRDYYQHLEIFLKDIGTKRLKEIRTILQTTDSVSARADMEIGIFKQELDKREEDAMYPLYHGILTLGTLNNEYNDRISKYAKSIGYSFTNVVRDRGIEINVLKPFIDSTKALMEYTYPHHIDVLLGRKLIRDDKTILEPYVNTSIDKKTGDIKYHINSSYLNNLSKSLEAITHFTEGDWKKGVASIHTLVKDYDYSDETGMLSMRLVLNALNYIDSADHYDEEEKALIKAELIQNVFNKLHQSNENIAILGDNYAEHIDEVVNELYKVNKDIVGVMFDKAGEYSAGGGKSKNWNGLSSARTAIKKSGLLEKFSGRKEYKPKYAQSKTLIGSQYINLDLMKSINKNRSKAERLPTIDLGPGIKSKGLYPKHISMQGKKDIKRRIKTKKPKKFKLT